MKPFFLFFFLTVAGCSHAAIKDSVGTKIKDGKTYIVHKVSAGETMYAISKKYKVSITDILRWNDKSDAALDLNEEVLILSKDQSTSSSGKVHVVQTGETLYSISRKYDIPVDKIKQMNQLTSNSLSIGQQLKLSGDGSSGTNTPSSSTGNRTHTVQAGETLYSIARKYRTSVDNIKAWNSLTTNALNIGQVVIVEKSTNSTSMSSDGAEETKVSNTVTSESGTATELTDDRYANKYSYCFHKSAPKGTIIKVINTQNGKFIYARVMGKSKTLIQVNSTVMKKLGASGSFEVNLSYYL